MDEMTYMILKIVVSVCVALLTTFVIPYVRRLAQNARMDSLFEAASVAVSAAEQTVKGDGMGKEKKQKALHFMADWLTTHGMTIHSEQLDGLIEAAVYAMKEGKQ